jgi:hypothetical protein
VAVDMRCEEARGARERGRRCHSRDYAPDHPSFQTSHSDARQVEEGALTSRARSARPSSNSCGWKEPSWPMTPYLCARTAGHKRWCGVAVSSGEGEVLVCGSVVQGEVWCELRPGWHERGGSRAGVWAGAMAGAMAGGGCGLVAHQKAHMSRMVYCDGVFSQLDGAEVGSGPVTRAITSSPLESAGEPVDATASHGARPLTAEAYLWCGVGGCSSPRCAICGGTCTCACMCGLGHGGRTVGGCSGAACVLRGRGLWAVGSGVRAHALLDSWPLHTCGEGMRQR